MLGHTPDISVLVPVYNGIEAFRELLLSLESTYPAPRPGLRFLFLDDASTDPRMSEIYQGDFFRRPDVELHHNPKNLGFIRTVNRAASLAPSESDLVLLNSDTQVWQPVFEIFRDLSQKHPRVASLTPLTNNCTIASLFGWPDGDSGAPLLPPRELAEIVARARFETPYFPTPTGIGFCMYIPRHAWNVVGELDPVFGRGYGEECDWSRRAIREGYDHLIVAEAYVHHSGTQSFSSAEKKALIEKNSLLLEERNPGYGKAVRTYLREDPLRAERFLLVSEIIRRACHKENECRTYFLTSHTDPISYEGGTERYIDQLRIALEKKGNAIITASPTTQGTLKFRQHFQSRIVFEGEFHTKIVHHVLRELLKTIDVLNVHHTLGWDQRLRDLLVESPGPSRVFMAHDYFSLCPTIQMVNGKRGFCEAETDTRKCNECLASNRLFASYRMDAYRRSALQFLRHFDRMIFPSEIVLQYFQKAFGAAFSALEDRCTVLPHDVSHLLPFLKPSAKSSTAETSRPLIVFVGHLGRHKGGPLVQEVIKKGYLSSFELEVWGGCYGWDYRALRKRVPIRPYQNVQELNALFEERRPSLVVLPFIWAETFSYVFFESLVLAGGAPIVVGPYGNPAALVRKFGLGEVMEDTSPRALAEACDRAMEKRDTLRRNIQEYIAATVRPRDYLQDFLQAFPKAPRAGPASFQLLPALNDLGHTALLSGRLLGERASAGNRALTKLRKTFKRYERTRYFIRTGLNLGWETKKMVREWIHPEQLEQEDQGDLFLE